MQPTTLHLTKVIDGKLLKLGVCANCPEAVALKGSKGFDLIEDTSGVKQTLLPSDSRIKCPNCGLTPADFKEFGRLGCSNCFDVFAVKLEPLYKKLHNGDTHIGKAPRGHKRSVSVEEIEALKKRLREYVDREEYELAAVVRDQIKSLEEAPSE